MKKNRNKEIDVLTTIMKFTVLGAAGLGFLISESILGAIYLSITFGGILMSLYLIMFYIRNKKYKERLLNSGIDVIDQMDGFQFESYLRQLFKSQNYKVIKTPDRKDFGADLLLEKNGTKIVVQAKRYKGNVGIKAVQEIQSAKLYYKAQEAWVMTNSNYTKSAKELAYKTNVTLLDRDRLIDYISEINPNGEVSATQTIETVEPLPIKCKCGNQMILKKNKSNQKRFYGCRNFPSCKNTKAL